MVAKSDRVYRMPKTIVVRKTILNFLQFPRKSPQNYPQTALNSSEIFEYPRNWSCHFLPKFLQLFAFSLTKILMNIFMKFLVDLKKIC